MVILLEHLHVGLQNLHQRASEPPVVDLVETLLNASCGDGEVEGVGQRGRGRQRRLPPLLPEVASQDVGAQRPSGCQQRSPRQLLLHVLYHRPHVVCVGGGVELSGGDRGVAGATAVEDQRAHAAGRRCHGHVGERGAAAGTAQPGDQDQGRGVFRQGPGLGAIKPVEGHCAAVLCGKELPAVLRLWVAAVERREDGLNVAARQEQRRSVLLLQAWGLAEELQVAAGHLHGDAWLGCQQAAYQEGRSPNGQAHADGNVAHVSVGNAGGEGGLPSWQWRGGCQSHARPPVFER
mmetsp:Transcript_17252/g.48108  ORF Transcript_17252/g.48108 Transcript_17252/m.48108 type:complete len:292 (+) Transcript_17252:631-1506(+)